MSKGGGVGTTWMRSERRKRGFRADLELGLMSRGNCAQREASAEGGG